MNTRLQKLVDIAGGLRGSGGAISVSADDFCLLVDTAVGLAPSKEPPRKPKKDSSRKSTSETNADTENENLVITADVIDGLRKKADALAIAEQLNVTLDESAKLDEMKAALHDALPDTEGTDDVEESAE